MVDFDNRFKEKMEVHETPAVGGSELDDLLSGEWHKSFVADVRNITGCSHEEAFEVLAMVVDIRECAEQRGFKRGVNAR